MHPAWQPDSTWAPAWDDAEVAFGRERARLADLIGQRVRSTWVAVKETPSWFRDLPVAIVFDDGAQLEICWSMGDQLSLTWNTVDLRAPADTRERRVWWRRDTEPALAAPVDATLTDIAMVTFPVRTGGQGMWFVHDEPYGVALTAGPVALAVFSDGSETGIDAEMTWLIEPGTRFTWDSVSTSKS